MGKPNRQTETNIWNLWHSLAVLKKNNHHNKSLGETVHWAQAQNEQTNQTNKQIATDKQMKRKAKKKSFRILFFAYSLMFKFVCGFIAIHENKMVLSRTLYTQFHMAYKWTWKLVFYCYLLALLFTISKKNTHK